MRRLFFAGTSRLTEMMPVSGARLLDQVVRPIAGSRALSALFEQRNRTIVGRMRRFRRFLVIADIHIGDAILGQSVATAIRDCFPDAAIDYVVNRSAATVIEGNPEITRVVGMFANARFPSAAEVDAVRRLIHYGRYDLCINLCPFIAPDDLADARQPLVDIMSHSPTIVRNDSDAGQVNHFSYQQYHFVRDLLGTASTSVRDAGFRGVRTTYADEAIVRAAEFTDDAGITERTPVIMFNPDAASPYCMMPFDRQAALLQRIARDAAPDTLILVGAGHTVPGIGLRLLDALPPPSRACVRIIPPALPLAAYAALIDYADLFITGDTGPLHLAAARRVAGTSGHEFRNRTAVLSIFGATMPRMSGYDSFQPGYIPANQDAPSWCYQAGSRCRNITCLNKMMKTCRTVRCFEDVDVDGLAAVATSYLAGQSAGHRPLAVVA